MTWARFWRAVDQARTVPRVSLIAYGWMTWTVTQWFMGLGSPTNAQGMFVSVVYGAVPFLLNFYMQNGVRWEPPPAFPQRLDRFRREPMGEGEGK